MEDKPFKCLLCDNDDNRELVSPTLRDDSSGKIQVFRCLTCGHVQLFPIPAQDENLSFYRADGLALDLFEQVDVESIKQSSECDTKRRAEWVYRKNRNHGKILDIGCGYGFFVDRLTKMGLDVTGMDIGTERLNWAKQNLAGSFIEGQLNDEYTKAHPNRYHVITMFHMLEHVQKPHALLKTCMSLLIPKGRLLIEVPNVYDELIKKNEEYNNFYWQHAHLSYFDYARLELLFRRSGCENFSIAGLQRFGIRNLIHWIDTGKPQLTKAEFIYEEPALKRLELLYSEDKEKTLMCDTLIAEIIN